MPTDDEVFAQQRQMAVTRALRPRAFSHTTYVDGAYDSYDPGEGEEGEVAPAWVPADAKIHIDFLGGTPQGRAWVDGTGAVDVDTLLGTDANINPGSGWGDLSEYNPASLSADGYGCAFERVCAFIGSARTMILAGATSRIVIKNVISPFYTPLMATSEEGDDASYCDATDGMLGVYNWSDGMLDDASVLLTGVGSVNVFAITRTPARIEAAANGNPSIAASAIDETEFPRVVALFDVKGSKGIVQSITIYDPLPSTAGLPGLSEP